MDIPLRLLIIEDSKSDVALEVRQLEAGGYRVTYEVAETAAEMKAALIKQSFDIVISDHSLPQFDATGALAMLKQSGLDIPFIIVSGAIGEETAVALMKAGAHDYVMKDKLSRLCPAIARELKDAEVRARRKQAESARLTSLKALLESQERYKALFDCSLNLIYVMNFDGKFIDANKAALDLLGYKREEIRSVNVNSLVDEDQLPLVLETIREIIKTGIQTDLHEIRLRNKDGREIYVEAQGSIVMSKGKPVAIQVIARDITEHKRADELLKKSESKYRLLADNIHDVIFVMDMDLKYSYLSPSVKLLRGYEPEEAMKQTPAQTVTPSSLNLALGILSEVMELEKSEHRDIYVSRTFQVEMSRKDGTTVWTEVKASLIRDENQRAIGIMGVTRDITDRKQSEDELQKTLGRLRKSIDTTIGVLVSAVESRDPYTAGHQLRVADLARAIATEMGLPQDKIDGIRMAGSIHDIGKLSIPVEILSKPTKLTDIEFTLIKGHSKIGYEMLKDVESPWPLAQIVYQHHERMNGTGYPRNLKGDEILMEARIMTVADVVEAIASHRPYRAALGVEIALEEIEKNKGVFYDATVADACLRLFREKGYQFT